jgi:hypothetical protein
MRARLVVNRHGKLTGNQWKDMVTEPLVTLLLLLAPTIMILGPRVMAVTVRGLWLVAIAFVLMVIVPMVFRAQRYARAPVHFDTFYAGDYPTSRLLFWKPLVLYTADGQPVRFVKRLAPRLRLNANRAYLVYYLKDARQHVLLSIAPVDHPDAAHWQPSETFQMRFNRRTGRY